jgi:hypothetical protein
MTTKATGTALVSMEAKWDYLCSELGILEDEKKKELIRWFVDEAIKVSDYTRGNGQKTD